MIIVSGKDGVRYINDEKVSHIEFIGTNVFVYKEIIPKVQCHVQYKHIDSVRYIADGKEYTEESGKLLAVKQELNEEQERSSIYCRCLRDLYFSRTPTMTLDELYDKIKEAIVKGNEVGKLKDKKK